MITETLPKKVNKRGITIPWGDPLVKQYMISHCGEYSKSYPQASVMATTKALAELAGVVNPRCDAISQLDPDFREELAKYKGKLKSWVPGAWGGKTKSRNVSGTPRKKVIRTATVAPDATIAPAATVTPSSEPVFTYTRPEAKQGAPLLTDEELHAFSLRVWNAHVNDIKVPWLKIFNKTIGVMFGSDFKADQWDSVREYIKTKILQDGYSAFRLLSMGKHEVDPTIMTVEVEKVVQPPLSSYSVTALENALTTKKEARHTEMVRAQHAQIDLLKRIAVHMTAEALDNLKITEEEPLPEPVQVVEPETKTKKLYTINVMDGNVSTIQKSLEKSLLNHPLPHASILYHDSEKAVRIKNRENSFLLCAKHMSHKVTKYVETHFKNVVYQWCPGGATGMFRSILAIDFMMRQEAGLLTEEEQAKLAKGSHA